MYLSLIAIIKQLDGKVKKNLKGVITMTVKELEKVIGGTISKEIKKEYIKAVNKLVNAIISYIEATSAEEMLKSMKEAGKAHREAIRLIDEKFNSKEIDINEHLRLCKYTTKIYQEYLINVIDNKTMSAYDFTDILIDEEVIYTVTWYRYPHGKENESMTCKYKKFELFSEALNFATSKAIRIKGIYWAGCEIDRNGKQCIR